MRALVVYESMYGNTHLIAEAIAEGLRASAEVTVVPVTRAQADLLEVADLVVVGGPTHAHGMSRPTTRRAALEAAAKPGSGLRVEPDSEGDGLRDWFASLGPHTAGAAAFDTRVEGPVVLTGCAAKGIGKMLRRHGFPLVAGPESFFVTRDNHLQPGEEERARRWGEQLVANRAPV